MYKFALFFLSTVFAKLNKPSYEYILFEQFNELKEYPSIPLKRNLPSNAWVLSLNADMEGKEGLKLRTASYEEARGVFGSLMDDGPSYRQPRVMDSPNDKKVIKEDEKAMLGEIMRVINKFALTTNSEPDVYLSEDGDKTAPTLKLYFRGIHTTLVVKAENREWHYVIKSALFPNWFYQVHQVNRDERGQFVEVPRDVAGEFYVALFRVLRMFLTYPI